MTGPLGRWVARQLQRAWRGRGWLARALLPLALLFAALVSLRRALFALGWLRTAALRVPVVVVGNLIVGGAGKTPSVIAIVASLRDAGHLPGIVSRGYGGDAVQPLDVQPQTPAARCGDEPLLLRLRCGVPVVVGRDRAAAATALLALHPTVDVIVSDDGLQHLRLPRRAQVLVFDERGAGNGWLLPAGPLRERLPQALPEASLVLYNAPAATVALPGHVARRRLRGVVRLDAWWRGRAASPSSLLALRGRRLLAVAGLAQPERFFGMLREHGLTIDALPLADHHDYAALPWPSGTADVVLTEKDAVKIAPERVGATRVWVATLDFEPPAAFDAALIDLLFPPRTPHGNASP